MSRSERVRWHCPNQDCNTWFVETIESSDEAAPLCICGRTMQKEGVDGLGYLDFLREGTAEAEAGVEKR
jgi:hypothetical protein